MRNTNTDTHPQSFFLQKNHPKYGNSIVICGQYCMLGPQYFVFLPCMIIIAALLTFIYFQIRQNLLPTWQIIIPIAIFLQTLSYILIGLSNPGILVEKNQGHSLSTCEHCFVYKVPKSRHCNHCGSCIDGYDHHCPFIGKCVGSNNIIRFYFFLLMMLTSFVVVFLGIIHSSAVNQDLRTK